MKHLVTKLVLAVATAATSFAGSLSADTYGLEFGIGYRQDSLLWKVKDHGEVNPHAESDLHFKDLEIVLIGGKFKGMLGCSFYTRTTFDYGWIVDGTMREELSIEKRHGVKHFDHNGVFQSGDFAKAVVHNKEHGNSYVWDFNLAFGIPFQLGCEGSVQIAPMVGFAYDRQQIKVDNREKFYADSDHHHPRIHTGSHVKKHQCKGGRSHAFRTSWWGPWIGFDLNYTSDNCWTFYAEFELRGGRVERTRNSNIGVEFFDRYERTKYFWGTTTRLGTSYVLCQNWYLEAEIAYSHWNSKAHRDTVYFSSGTARVDLGYLF